MNGPFVQDQAEALAGRLLHESSSDQALVRRAFLLCFSRTPDDEEERRSLAFLRTRSPAAAAEGTAVDRVTLVSFCQALLSTAEFRNLD